jgi:hypothetical protein
MPSRTNSDIIRELEITVTELKKTSELIEEIDRKALP